MPTLTSHRFSFSAPVAPTAIWAALTNDRARFLYRMGLTSSWQQGAPLVLDAADAGRLEGTIHFACEPERVTYSIDDPSGPSTYLTWEVRPAPTGSVVHLTVDDSEGETDEDAENIWLPVLERLHEEIRRTCGSPTPQG